MNFNPNMNGVISIYYWVFVVGYKPEYRNGRIEIYIYNLRYYLHDKHWYRVEDE